MHLEAPPPPDSEPRTAAVRFLLQVLPILPAGAGVRVGYGLACVGAGLAGAPLIGIIGGGFLILSALTHAPPSLTAVAALFVSSIFDLGGGYFDSIAGAAVFSVSIFAMTLIDDDVELGLDMKNDLDASISRINQVTDVESIMAANSLREKLGIASDKPNPLGFDEVNEWEERLREIDENNERS
jgi:hypothetical protein